MTGQQLDDFVTNKNNTKQWDISKLSFGIAVRIELTYGASMLAFLEDSGTKK